MPANTKRGAAPLGRTRKATFRVWVMLTATALVVGGGVSLLVGFADPSMAVAAVIVPIVDILLVAIGLGWLVWLVRSDARPTHPVDR